MAASTEPARTERGYSASASIAFLAMIGAKAKAVVKALQVARMLSTLSDMSDYQLMQIGISRSDIPKYAAKLMADE